VIEEVVMTVTMHEPSTTGSARNGIAARLLVPGFWGAVSIIASVVLVALFACLATISVARHAFRGRDAD
jgi:hypothetical protein